MYYLPWWVLLACLLASGLAAYLALRDSALSRRALFALTVVLAPLVLLGAVVAALAVSVMLSVLHERTMDRPEPPARIERTGPTTTVDHPIPVTTAPTASPSATASPSVTASATASATASPTAGARTPPRARR